MGSQKRVWGLVLGLLLPAGLSCAQAVAPEAAWVSAREAQIEQAIEQLQQAPVATGAIPRALQQAAQQTAQAHRQRYTQWREAHGQALPPIGPMTTQLVVYVSMSLGRSLLEELFAVAAGREEVLIVFRGVTPGQRVPAFAMALHDLASQAGPDRPNIAIDPTLFTLAGIDAVPVIAAVQGQGETAEVIASAQGILNLDWFQTRLDAGKSGEWGQFGPLSAIAEPDLIEEMKRRAAGLDFDAMKRRALASYWRNAHFETLAPAREPRERWIDPTVRVARDVMTPSGTVVAAAGTTVNPLDHIGFNRRLIIFDGDRPEQRRQARELAMTAGQRKSIYLVTGLAREQGWEALKALEAELQGTVYLLTPELRQRFAIEHTVSLVEAVGNRFRVEEFVTRASATEAANQ